MLVKFDSHVGSFSMFGETAKTLLHMMGHSGTIPSAILAEDIPAALARLEQAVADAPDPPEADDDEDPEKKSPVSLRQRAFPLIELLRRAAEGGHSVTWSKA
jgi:hypothetical protein